MFIKKRFQIISLVILVVLIAGCSPDESANKITTETILVESQNAESVDINITLGAGELILSGGAEDLLEGYFAYNNKRWAPELEYEVIGGKGNLNLRQTQSTSGITSTNEFNKWDIYLNNDIPSNLNIQFGAGASDLVLGGLSLRNFDLKAGAGNITIDFLGEYDEDLRANITGGVGKAVLVLPKETGVIIDAKGALGSITTKGLSRQENKYVNESYGESEATIYIDIKGGVGDITLMVIDD